VFLAGLGRFDEQHLADLVELARTTAERSQQPHALALATGIGGIVDFIAGRWQQAQVSCERAERMFREQCKGVAWELATANFFILSALYYSGELAELSRRAPALVRDADERNDLYAAASLRTWPMTIIWLAADDAARARADVDEAMRRWSREGFHVQHCHELLALCHADLYESDPRAGWERLEAAWPRMQRSLILRPRNLRVSAWHMRARCALAMRGGELPEREAIVRRAIRVMQGARLPWCTALAALVEGGLTRELDLAIAACESAGLGLFAAAARYQRGDAAGEQWMRERGVRNPHRMAALLVPLA
jgi:hypothetical protein